MPAVTHSRGERAALGYARLGWRVLPLHTPGGDGVCSCGLEDCPKPGKHPRTRHGVRNASASAETISSLWATWPDANVGLATGALLVVDVDGATGDQSLHQLQREHRPLPATLEATTGRGRHLYFRGPPQPIGNSAGRLGEGLDVRGHGGYVVAPPSLHAAAGRRYRWRSRRRPVTLPAWVAELLAATPAAAARTLTPPPAVGGEPRRRYFTAALRAELADVASAQPGTRNDTLNRAAFRLAQLVADGAGTLDQLEHDLLDAALAAGLGEPEARATIGSGLSAGQQHPRR